MKLIKKEFTKEEKIAIENYLNQLLDLTKEIDNAIHFKKYYDASALTSRLHDKIGDLFPFDIEFD